MKKDFSPKSTQKQKTTISEMVSWLNQQYAEMIAMIGEDYSLNGLQVDGRLPVGSSTAPLTKIAYAVDACQQSIDEAAKTGAQLLVVHHGLFWGHGMENVTGCNAARIGTLLRKQISLYGMHLPMDGHRQMGHNAQLAQLLGLQVEDWIDKIGCVAIAPQGKSLSLAKIITSLKKILVSTAPLKIVTEGNKEIQRVAIVSGSGASLLPQAKLLNCDLLLTGEVSHSRIHELRESGLSVIEAGHYATEIFGLRALAKLARKTFPSVTWIEVSSDTGR